jgi:hypothetical protein
MVDVWMEKVYPARCESSPTPDKLSPSRHQPCIFYIYTQTQDIYAIKYYLEFA